MQADYQRIVVKIGTSTLTGGETRLSQPRILNLVGQIARLHTAGRQVILITSGAIAAGREVLRFPELSKYIPGKQMLAAVGQPRLMELYAQLFRIFDLGVAQVLLTRRDLADRHSYLNARNTLEALLTQKVIPVVNENDTVATEEIRVGDNDNLSALVANLVEAGLLVLLTDQAGLYTGDPRSDPEAVLIREIDTPEIPAEVWQAAGGTSTGLGTGGMLTKLRAADLARRSGTAVVIADGGQPDILQRILSGEPAGTFFQPLISTLESRKRFLLAGMKTSRGLLNIDGGAAAAVRQGASLLPAGVVSAQGRFNRGDVVQVSGPEGAPIAVGISNYDPDEIARLCGRRSEEIEKLLGYTFGDEIIHHNNLVLL